MVWMSEGLAKVVLYSHQLDKTGVEGRAEQCPRRRRGRHRAKATATVTVTKLSENPGRVICRILFENCVLLFVRTTANASSDRPMYLYVPTTALFAARKASK